MDEAFIIMQIGDASLEAVCDEVIVPAIEATGLVPRRVDRDNSGDLLKREIVDFLERAQIIVADLTNERPNCYLEVGYAMGLGKKANLILMAREDHHHRSPNYKLDGPRVHFDLEGYDLLLWDPSDPAAFRTELERRIRRRLAIVRPAVPPDLSPAQPTPQADDDWLERCRERASAGLQSVGRSIALEVVVALEPKGRWRQQELLSAADQAQIHTFGWPIGIVLSGHDAGGPHPTSDGVEAEVAIGGEHPSNTGRASYDYWYLRRSGDYFMLKSLFEEERSEDAIFFDTRIVRTTELLLFLSRLYTRLGVSEGAKLSISTSYRGLSGRRLASANRRRLMSEDRRSNEDSVSSSVEASIAELQTDLVNLVRELLEPVFVLFDFFELSDTVWSEIVDAFVEGRVA